MSEGTVGVLNVEINADLTNLQSGFASAKAQTQNFSAQAGSSFSGVGEKATKAGQDVAGLGTESQKTGEKISGAGKQGTDGIGLIADALIAIGAVTAFSRIYDGFKQCIDASVEFESAIAGVAKTTNLSDMELSAMGDSIKKMATEIPATTTEIAGVAEAAGQLGISGSENLLEFTETMTMLGTATNMTSEEGATMLAQFANITQMPTGEYSNLGSTIVALGNSTATTEQKITDMAQGMAASGTNAGISEASILSLAAATASVGIEADAGSTSWSKFMQEMQSAVETGEDLDQWASVANMTASEFTKLWGQDAAQAMNVWVQGLGTAAAQGQSMTGILGELNITEVREVRMLQSLANSGDLLTNALETGNQAWKQNTALQKEAATRYATTESKAKMLANRQQNLAATVGDQLNPLYSNLLDIGTDVTDFFQDMFEQNELLGPALASVATGATVAGGAFLAYSAGMKIKSIVDAQATVTQYGLNTAMYANPVFLIVTGVVALTAALSVFALSLAEADAETQALNAETESLLDSMDDAVVASQAVDTEFAARATTTDGLISKLDELTEAEQLNGTQQAEMRRTVAELNAMFPELGLSIETTGNSADGLTMTLKSTNSELTDADGNVTDVTGALKEMAEEANNAQKQQAKFETTVNLFGQMKDAQQQVSEHNAKMNSSVAMVAQTMGIEADAARELVESFAGAPDVFANTAMAQIGMDEKTRDAIESFDENSKSVKELEEKLAELEGALKAVSGGEVELADVVYDAAGNVEYLVDVEGNRLNMQGEVLATEKELKTAYLANQQALAAQGITINDYIEGAANMTAVDAENYAQQLLLGEQYDALLEKYGTLGVTRQEYIDQTVGKTEAELNEYNQMLLNDAAMATMSVRYQELKDSALNSLQSQFDAWEMVDNSVVTNAQSIADALASQNTSYDNYAANIETAMSRGFTASELMALGMGEYSEESAAAIAGLAVATDSEVGNIKSSLESAPASADKLSGAFADLGVAVGGETEGAGKAMTGFSEQAGTDFDATAAKVGETKDSVSGDLDTIGSDVKGTMNDIKGYVEDLNDTMPEIKFKVDQDLKLPHFSMTGQFDAKTGGVPAVGVNWYDKGGIFDTPQIIGIAERRSEFVGAAEDLESFITKAVNSAVVKVNPAILYDLSVPTGGDTYGGDTIIEFKPQVTINAQKLTDAELRRATDFVSREFAKAVPHGKVGKIH